MKSDVKYVTMRQLLDMLYIHSRDCTRVLNEKLGLDNADIKEKSKLYHGVVLDALNKLRADLLEIQSRIDRLERRKG